MRIDLHDLHQPLTQVFFSHFFLHFFCASFVSMVLYHTFTQFQESIHFWCGQRWRKHHIELFPGGAQDLTMIILSVSPKQLQGGHWWEIMRFLGYSTDSTGCLGASIGCPWLDFKNFHTMVLECLICPTSKPWSTTLWRLWDTHGYPVDHWSIVYWPFWSFFCPWTLPKSVACWGCPSTRGFVERPPSTRRHGLRNSRTLLGLCTSDLPFGDGLYHPLNA